MGRTRELTDQEHLENQRNGVYLCQCDPDDPNNSIRLVWGEPICRGCERPRRPKAVK